MSQSRACRTIRTPHRDTIIKEASILSSSLTVPTMLATRTHSQSFIEPLKQFWGCLLPLSSSVQRIDFDIMQREYTIGRDNEINSVVLPGPTISAYILYSSFFLSPKILYRSDTLQGSVEWRRWRSRIYRPRFVYQWYLCKSLIFT